MDSHGGDLPDLPSDADEDETLRYAIALSLREQGKAAPEAVANPEPTKTSQNEANFGSLQLDRKAMEAERLKRLAAKRPRASSSHDDDDVVEVEPPKKKAATKPPIHKQLAITSSTSKSAGATSATPTFLSSKAPLRFYDGAVKKTWAYGYPRTSDDMKIEEVLEKDDLELALLSSFQWDDEWLLSKINLQKTKLLLVAFAKDKAQQDEMRENAPPNVRFCFPPMKGPGAMHSKLQILKYPDHLRIVTPTGNLVPYDWGETGVMENMLFLIDLPLLPEGVDHKPTPFSTELSRFLTVSNVDEKMVSSLVKYDFSRTSKLGFVHTVPGSHMDELRRRTGYCGLGECVASLGMAAKSPIEMDIVAASLGAINTDLIGALYNACQGDNGMKEYNARTSRKSGAKPGNPSSELREHVRVYFPTDQTVAKSRGGRGAAGTICIQAKWWRSPTFPTGLVRDCESTRPGLLMHSKVIFVRPSAGSDASAASQEPSWAYVGSANLSESAWGRLVKDGKSGKPKMYCRNWECGVVVPVNNTTEAKPSHHSATNQPGTKPEATSSLSAAATTTITGHNATSGTDLSSIFASTVPVPMKEPGRPYGPNEEPWFYAGSH